MSTRWGKILGNVPPTGPRDDDDNVVHIATLDAIEAEIKDATNACVHLEAEADKIERAYGDAIERLRAAQMRLVERLRHLGIKAEIVEKREGV